MTPTVAIGEIVNILLEDNQIRYPNIGVTYLIIWNGVYPSFTG
jgi:hypothetical protein